MAGGGGGDELLVRRLLLHLVQDAEVGGDDEAVLGALDGGLQQLAGGADDIGQRDHAGRGFGVDQCRCTGVLALEVGQFLGLEFVVDDAGALPQQHVGAGLAADVVAQMAIGAPDQLLALLAQVADDLQGDRGGDDPVGPRLHLGAGVGIDDDGAVGVLVTEGGKLVGRAAEVERAFGGQIGHQHGLVRAEDLGAFAHEAHAGHQQRLRRVAGTEAGHLQRIPDAAAGFQCQILQFRYHIIVGDQDGLALPE